MKNKVYSIILSLFTIASIVTVFDVKALENEVCKQQTHWYYFSLADHATKEAIESNSVDATYSTKFSKETWPKDAKVNSIKTYKGFTKDDIVIWYDLLVANRIPVYTDANGEVHHVHDDLYRNEDNNSSNTDNVYSSAQLNYDALLSQNNPVLLEQFRQNFINNVYNAQIMPSEAEVTFTNIEEDSVSAQIHRLYGGTSLGTTTAYNYVVNPQNPDVTNNVFLISAKVQVVLDYDCEQPEEPVTPEPTPEEPEEPLVEEVNPNTGDLGVILSSLMVIGAGGTGAIAYHRRKNL